MHDDSDSDDMPIKSAGTSSLISPTSKLKEEPGSNEFVNVVAPEEEEMAAKRLGIEAKTSSVEEILKPVEKLADAEPIPYSAERSPPMLDNDADTDASIFTNEMPLQLEPEFMSEMEQTEPLGVRGDDEGPKMPGSFDMPTAPPHKEMSWMEMLKNMGL